MPRRKKPAQKPELEVGPPNSTGKLYVFRSKFRRLQVNYRGAPNDHIQFSGAHTLSAPGEDGERRLVTMSTFRTENAKIARVLHEKVKECDLVEVIDTDTGAKSGDDTDSDDDKE